MSSSSSRSPSTVTMASAGSLPHGTSEMFAARAEVLQRDSTAAKCKMDLNLSLMCPSAYRQIGCAPARNGAQNDDRLVHYCRLSLPIGHPDQMERRSSARPGHGSHAQEDQPVSSHA